MHCREYYSVVVNRISQESEGRPSPKNQERGHAMEVHFDARVLLPIGYSIGAALSRFSDGFSVASGHGRTVDRALRSRLAVPF